MLRNYQLPIPKLYSNKKVVMKEIFMVEHFINKKFHLNECDGKGLDILSQRHPQVIKSFSDGTIFKSSLYYLHMLIFWTGTRNYSDEKRS